jgi:hypothetical protein
MNDLHVLQYSDDVRNAVAALLNLLAPRLLEALPPRSPMMPHVVDVMGGGSHTSHDVVVHRRPAWDGCRVVMQATPDGVITVEAATSKGFAEIWRSDTPMIVPTRRQLTESQDGKLSG